jgi:hypothetical protein
VQELKKLFRLNYSIFDVHLMVELSNEKNHQMNHPHPHLRHHQFVVHRSSVEQKLSLELFVQLMLNEENHIDQ